MQSKVFPLLKPILDTVIYLYCLGFLALLLYLFLFPDLVPLFSGGAFWLVYLGPILLGGLIYLKTKLIQKLKTIKPPLNPNSATDEETQESESPSAHQ